MHTNRLGSTDVEVTVLGFGGAQIGNLYTAIDDETAAAAVDAAWEGGVRYFDTAPHYGLGLSERRLGAALARRPRSEFIVSTKVGRLLVPNPSPIGSDLGAGGFAVVDAMTRRFDYSRAGVQRSLEASLQRLGVDRIDIVYVHDPDQHLHNAIHDAIPALIELRDQGVIAAVGAGMNSWQPLLGIVSETDVDTVMVAGRWTLADRSAAPLLAACAERSIAVVAAAPFNSGLLAQPWPADDAYFDYGPTPANVLARARTYARLCAEHGTTLPHAAMQFPRRHPAVACVVAGMRNAHQSASAVEWASRTLDAELWAALDAVPADSA